MKKIYFILIVLYMNSLWSQATTIYLIRHAEKADSSPDTNLSEAGKARAQKWAAYFNDKLVTAVYSTPYKRTTQTGLPLAQSIKQQIITYNPAAMDLKEIAAKYEGEAVVIVGHSNTITRYVNKIIGEDFYPDMNEDEFDHVYTVTIENGKISHSLQKL
jgi:2,3-bisphosphoglycerate-dependent phosphoglycerate mutase